jgi:D-sedoheptulose 7-phosphate isomerase
LLKRAVGQSEAETVARMVGGMADLYRRGGTLLVCGNGGSSADAQHMAGELVGRFLMERRALDCIALTTDSSVITAMANDYGYDTIFSRQVEAHGREGDILFAISTSGNSSNVLKAVEAARRLKMNVFALSGRDGGALAGKADVCLTVPSRECPRIQEIHITVIHIICDLVERMLFGT